MVDQPKDSAKAKADAIALAEQAEAEAAEAEALAAAARARARAIRLRREAEAHAEREEPPQAEPSGPAAAELPADAEPDATTVEATAVVDQPPAASRKPVRRWWRSARTPAFLATTAIVVICGLLGTSGYLIWHHHDVVEQRQRAAAFVAAAKQGIVNMTSLDFNKAKEDVQRVLDSATGEFKDDFQKRADDFMSVVEASKAVTEGSVTSAAIESMANDSAVVLILANERVTNAAGAENDPREFRFRVTVARDGDQLKMSKVEFVL